MSVADKRSSLAHKRVIYSKTNFVTLDQGLEISILSFLEKEREKGLIIFFVKR